MSNLWSKVIGDKKEWRSMEARADALPRDYRIVYGEMKQYMWRFTAGDGMDIVAVLKGVLGLFESSAAEGRHVLDVTGKDVAAFCDERLRGTASYADTWRASLNRDVLNNLGPVGRQG
jgi:DNA-binding ferritin-like protein (Dps family)